MKNRTLLYTVMSLLLVASLTSCGPSFVGVRTGPPYGPVYGYYGPGFYRPPVYVAPPPRPFYRRNFHRRNFYRDPRFSYRYNAPRQYGRGWNNGRGRRW